MYSRVPHPTAAQGLQRRRDVGTRLLGKVGERRAGPEAGNKLCPYEKCHILSSICSRTKLNKVDRADSTSQNRPPGSPDFWAQVGEGRARPKAGTQLGLAHSGSLVAAGHVERTIGRRT